MDIEVTAMVLVACVVLNLGLAGNISRLRMGARVALGDGGDRALQVAIRAHANLLENASWAILLFLVAELLGSSQWLLGTLGLAFVLSRLAHAWGFIRSQGRTHRGRYWGTLVSWLTLVALVVVVLWSVLTKLIT